MAIGNTKVDNLLRRVKLLSETIAWVKAFDTTTKEQVIEWIQKDQLMSKGIDKKGDVIGYYSLTTELISQGKKKYNTHYTLFDSGDFYRSMYVAVYRDMIEINADADKGEDNLFEKFGTGIIGLTDENFSKLKKIIQRSYINYAREVLQLAR